MNKITKLSISKVLYENYGENVCFSPSSLNDCLNILKEIISKKLLEKFPEFTNLKISEEDDSIQKYNGVLLNETQRHLFSDSVIKNLQETFDTKFFFGNLFSECNKIIEDKTKGLIKDFLNEFDFSELISLVGLNTIYFKSDWLQNIEKRYDINFNFCGKELTPLYSESYLKYYEGSHYDICELNFKSSDIKLFLINPIHTTLFHIIGNIDGVINNCKNVQSNLEVVLKFPEFKIESNFDIKNILNECGYRDLFEFTENWELYKNSDHFGKISTFIQKTYFSADKKGVEAAAATSFDVVLYSGWSYCPKPKEYKYITLENPFLFILAKDLDNPEFIGYVNKLD